MSLLNNDAAHLEAALWALQSVLALHPSNQAAAVQAGALPKLVGLLESGPDTAVAEYAADCLRFLAQVTFLPLHHLGMFHVIHCCISILCVKAASVATLSGGWLAAALFAAHGCECMLLPCARLATDEHCGSEWNVCIAIYPARELWASKFAKCPGLLYIV